MTEPRPIQDPFALWRQMMDANMEAWSKFFGEVSSTEQFSKAMGSTFDQYLRTYGASQKQLETFLERYLGSLHLPTRNDIAELAGQLQQIELRVDDLDEKLDDQVLDRLQQQVDTLARLVQQLGEEVGRARAGAEGKL